MVAQDRQGCGTHGRLKERFLGRRQSDHFVQQRPQMIGTAAARHRVEPISLALEGISGQRDLAAASPPINRSPVNFVPAHVEFAQAGQQWLPVSLPVTQAGQ